MNRFGTVAIKLDYLLTQRNLSKNKLIQRAELQRSQLNHYCCNQVGRIDLDVLARICTVLECRIEDILEFIPPQK